MEQSDGPVSYMYMWETIYTVDPEAWFCRADLSNADMRSLRDSVSHKKKFERCAGL